MRKVLPANWKKRIITGFLWFPVAIGREWRWLETATWEEEYYKSTDSPFGFWEKIRWCAPNTACSGQEPAGAPESQNVSGSCR